MNQELNDLMDKIETAHSMMDEGMAILESFIMHHETERSPEVYGCEIVALAGSQTILSQNIKLIQEAIREYYKLRTACESVEGGQSNESN